MRKKSQKRKLLPSKTKPKDVKKEPVTRPLLNLASSRLVIYIFLALTILFILIVRIRLLEFPLERDEGEYALMGQLILRGIPPYEMAYNMKLPGTYYMYAFIMAVFGQTISGIHLGLLITNVISIILVYLIGKKLINETAGLLAAVAFSFLSLSPGVFGMAAHATHFNALFALLGLISLLHYSESSNKFFMFLSAFCFGLSFTMKQQAVFFLPFGLIAFWLMERKRASFEWRKSILPLIFFGLIMLLPYLLVIVSTLITGTFDKFWHWTVNYAQQYVNLKTSDDGFRFLKLYFPYVTTGMLMFWLVGFFGLITLFISRSLKKYRWLVLAFVLSSLACVLPGFYFRPHYFVVFMPALALLVAVGLNYLLELFGRFRLKWLMPLPFFLFGWMLFKTITTHQEAFFTEEPERLCAKTFGYANPFQESIKIGEFIRANSTEGDKIAVIGSEPQIYFYSDRLPATGFIYTYPLMENQPYSIQMQREMIREVENSSPKFLVYVNSSYSWMLTPTSSTEIFDWKEQYQNNYNLVGVVNLNPSAVADYKWGDEAKWSSVKNKDYVLVFRRI